MKTEQGLWGCGSKCGDAVADINSMSCGNLVWAFCVERGG